MISKTQIEKRLRKKTNSYLVETIRLAKKMNSELASALAIPARKQTKINIDSLDKMKATTVIIPGKVLGNGSIKRKIKVYALGFSESAGEKLKNAGCEFKTILEALKKGDKLNGELIK